MISLIRQELFAELPALLKEKGAKSVRAVCTHPVLSGNAYENIESSDWKNWL
jgi:ribose-phosphate pyrophosphokinase